MNQSTAHERFLKRLQAFRKEGVLQVLEEVKLWEEEMATVIGRAVIEVKINKQHVYDVVSNAIEGDCCKWMEIDKDEEWFNRPDSFDESEWMTHLLLLGKTIYLNDSEEQEEKWELTLHKLIQGINAYLTTQNPDIENWDASDAGKVIQFALFDQVMYE